MRVVFVDNFDSFTFNLVDEFARRGCEVEVWRNDVPATHVLERVAATTDARLIVLSPGPGTPADAGCCIELVRQAAGRVALFGVCLGHQALVEAFGGRVAPAAAILHGRSSRIEHQRDRMFDGVPSPFVAGRYHSLCGHTLPPELLPLAWSGDILMAARHRHFPLLGVQFHPESILTATGGRIIDNVLREATEARA